MIARVLAAALVAAGSLATVEDDYGSARSLKDQADVAIAGGGTAHHAGRGLPRAYAALRARVAGGLPAAEAKTEDDRRAVAVMQRALQSDLPALLDEPAPSAPDAACTGDAAVIARGPEAWDRLRAHLYRCFGAAASSLRVGDEEVDRLTILGRLGDADDPAERRRLFLALQPLWRAVNGDNGPESPYRQLVRLGAERARTQPSTIAAELDALGVPEKDVEGWLVAILEGWRAAHPGTIEPWDFWAGGREAAHALDPLAARDRLEAVNAAFYRALGADVARLKVEYDLLPRPGKTPVAFTTFGSRAPDRDGVWRAGGVNVFATYRAGGLGNLVELLHETGHAVHVAAIRTRAAFADWPDSTTFTEAIADVPALDAYEPEWQRRYLGGEAPAVASLRAKYAGIVLDVAWGLFEMRLARTPEADPNALWTDITSTYLGIRSHPEWSWWALRGQLVDEPGYMVHYAVGAVLAADVRARCRALRGPFSQPDAGYYEFLSKHLYRFGLERPARTVLADFLGRPVSSDAILADLRRLRP
ncbi:MAG: hypothetical protein ABW221_23755 [Vicinamibacteria bacterium]